MKAFITLVFAVAAISLQAVLADLPKVALLKPGEQLNVSMSLQGYTITQADFTFTSGKVAIRSQDKNLGELALTAEEMTQVDEYLNAIRLGEVRRPEQEGFTCSISFSRDQQMQNWTFMIIDARESEKPALSLHELEKRLEAQRKQKQFDDPADGYFQAYLLTQAADKTTDREESIRRLKEALACFQAVKSRFPEWKPPMVDARILTTQESIARLSKSRD